MIILLAEDDENDAMLLQRAFQKVYKPVRLKMVRDGNAVVDYLSGSGSFADREKYPLPSLLVIDLKMPKKNGFEVLEWLKAHPTFKRIPAIVMSSSRQERDILKAYDLHANSYLVKPSAFDDLLKTAEGVYRYWINLNKLPTVNWLA